ncbi:MAG: C40 family peptidase [Mycobacteriales bacterium]
MTGAEQIAQARVELDALNEKVDAAVEDFNVGTIALDKAQKDAQLADTRVARSRAKLARLKAEYGTVAAAAYRGGAADGFVSLVMTSSPQTFLDRASTLDHIARNKRDQMLVLRAADRELRAASDASDVALGKQQAVAVQLAKTKAAIDKDVAQQEKLLKQLETDEAKRIAAEIAERKRQAALAAARARAKAERARLARIEAARVARVATEKRARLQREAQLKARARMNQQRAVAAAAAEAAALEAAEEERAARVAEAAAAAEEARDNQEAEAAERPEPKPEPDPEPSPEPEPSGGSRASIAVRSAYAQLGKRYVWAADGPNTFDCSGLTMYVWAKAGVSLPHSSRAQFHEGRRVSRSELRSGDLVFFGSPIHHVGIFIGGGQYIAAPQTGDVVSIRSMARNDYTGAVRL